MLVGRNDAERRLLIANKGLLQVERGHLIQKW
jgi:hypothetical protein